MDRIKFWRKLLGWQVGDKCSFVMGGYKLKGKVVKLSSFSIVPVAVVISEESIDFPDSLRWNVRVKKLEEYDAK